MEVPPQVQELNLKDLSEDVLVGNHSTANSEVHLSDYFYLYQYKIQACPKTYSHDWTQCVYAHPTENARRRDSRLHSYSPTPCPNYKRGVCLKGDNCQYSHGVFERWLHPCMFKTRICADSTRCQRKCCFFAHTQEELREPPAKLRESQDSQAKEEPIDLGVQAPRMSNSLIRSLGLNPKDHAMVNVQKLLKAFQNRDLMLQFQAIKDRPTLQEEALGQRIIDSDNGFTQQYAYGLDSSMVNFMGQQFGFDEEQINNLQRQFLQIKENNSFKQVLNNASTPIKGPTLPFSPPFVDDNQNIISNPFNFENSMISPHTLNTESSLEDMFTQLILSQSQVSAGQLEVPILNHQSSQQRLLAQIQAQSNMHSTIHSQQLSQQNSQRNQLVHLQHRSSLRDFQSPLNVPNSVISGSNYQSGQMSYQNSLQDQALYHSNSQRMNGLQVFSPEIQIQNQQTHQVQDHTVQPNLVYDYLEGLQQINYPQNEIFGNYNSFDSNYLTELELQRNQSQVRNQYFQQIYDNQQALMTQNLQNALLGPNLNVNTFVLPNSAQILDNQMQLKPEIQVNKQVN